MAVYKKGKHWYIDFYVHGQRTRKKIGPSKQVAELALKDVQVKIAKHEYLGIYEEKKILFRDLAREYMTWTKVNKARSTYGREVSIVNTHLVPRFGDRYLPNISRKQIEGYLTQRKGQVNVATVNRELACIKKMLRKAVEWDYLKQSPAVGIKQSKEHPMPPRYLTKEEVARLLDECPRHIYAIIVTALYTGMRRGEIFHLEWDDMDFIKRLITVNNKQDWHTKSHKPRAIPMNDFLFQTLSKHPRRISSPYVFPNSEGKTYNTIRKSFGSALERAGIGHIRFHDLRHTFASHLVMAGVDLASVQKLMGHKNITTTMRYAHLAPEHLRAAVERLDFTYGHYMDTIWTPKPKTIQKSV